MTDERRRWMLPVIAVVTSIFLLSVMVTAFFAFRAKQSLDSAKEAIASGEQERAAVALDTAQQSTGSLRTMLNYSPVAALKLVPLFRTNIEGADQVITAAEQLIPAAAYANDLYRGLSDGGLFSNGVIHYERLEAIPAKLPPLADQLAAAQATLESVPDLAYPLSAYRDQALSEVTGISNSLPVIDRLVPKLPELLGDETPQNYLLVFHNPAELFPGGGASLSAAVLRFDKGKMDVVDKGAISSYFFPGNPSVPWDPKAGEPYYETENATDGFAWSNLHPDYRVSGEDLMRSWVANGGQPVDGVISLDPLALEAAVAASGPIDSPGYGQITADNLVQKLLYDGYETFEADRSERHEINDDLIDGMLTRLQDGNTAMGMGRAIFATAPQQHIRIHLSENRLAKILSRAAVDGRQPKPQSDRIAFYTQNQNQSKVDIFQERSLTHEVELSSAGGATVTQTAVVANNAPDTGWPLTERIGYRTRWAFHWNVVPLPEDSEDVTINANDGEIRRDDREFTDIDGHRVVRIGRWIPPGESSTITTTYRLPDGTFGTGPDLVYRASVESQLLINGTDLTVRVTGPGSATAVLGDWDIDGGTAILQREVRSPDIIEVAFTS